MVVKKKKVGGGGEKTLKGKDKLGAFLKKVAPSCIFDRKWKRDHKLHTVAQHLFHCLSQKRGFTTANNFNKTSVNNPFESIKSRAKFQVLGTDCVIVGDLRMHLRVG